MLGYFMKASDVGIYNAACVVALQLIIFLSAFIAIFSPIASDLYNRKSHKELEKLFKIVTRWIFSLTLPLFIIVLIFSEYIMSIFGSSFVVGSSVLVILGFAQLINAATGPVGILLHMTGKQDIDFANGALLLFVNFGLNLWLIPFYGVIGAAIATGISLILIHVLRLIEVAKVLKMNPYDKCYFKPIGAGVIAVAIGFAFKQLDFSFSMHEIWILGSIIACLASYIATLYILKLDQEDRLVLLAFKNKIQK
jgi:O-antigen/teichoic acid export membrane protein